MYDVKAQNIDDDAGQDAHESESKSVKEDAESQPESPKRPKVHVRDGQISALWRTVCR